MTLDLNQPAFPSYGAHMHGMTLRDYIAVRAMQALIAKYDGEPETLESIPETAYLYADGLLKERSKNQ